MTVLHEAPPVNPNDAARQLASRLACRDWWLGALASLARVRGTAGTIDRHSHVDRSRFVDDYYCANRPLLMPGVANDWPAVSRWHRQYLKDVCGAEVVEVMGGRSAAPIPQQNTADRLRQYMTFAEYVDLVYERGSGNDYYLVSRNRFFDRPGTSRLLEDVRRLPFLTTLPTAGDVRMWFGPAGTVTPLHYDDRNNVIVQVVGRKAVTLYAPYDSECMAQRQPWYAGADPADDPQSGLPHRPAATPISFELSAGDALFLPVGWWHAITSLDVSITLAFVDFGLPNTYPMRRAQ